jgi:hypothetical protein
MHLTSRLMIRAANLYDQESCSAQWVLSQVPTKHYIRDYTIKKLLTIDLGFCSSFAAMTVIAGMIIGSGIFSTPSGILISVGSVGMSMFIWVIAAIASFSGVLAYLELGSVS